MERTFICNVVPPEYIVRLGASQAANNFCSRLIEGNCFDDVRSITPISYSLPQNISYNDIRFYVNGGGSSFSKFYRCIYLNVKLALGVREAKSIWFYNLVPVTFLAFIILKFILFKKVYVIMADYTPSSSRVSLQYYIGFFLGKCNGMISLSSRSCFGEMKNLSVKAGIVDEEMLKNTKAVSDDEMIFLFSGTLSEVTGYDMALRVFSQIPNAKLYVSGNGHFPEFYKQCSNIHFMGNMDYEDYLHLLDRATVCLNFRNPDLPENNNNFPSKLLDYLSRGKIVISTMSYPEIKGANYMYVEYDESLLINKIKTLLELDNVVIEKFRDNTQYLKDNFSVSSWKETMSNIDKVRI